MIPAPAQLYACPHCGKRKPMLSLISGNTLYGELWSDGRGIYPMLPSLSAIQKCSRCGRYSLLEKWKVTRRTNKKEFGTTGDLSYIEAKEAFLKLRFSTQNTKELYEIALSFVYAYNDEFRRHKFYGTTHQCRSENVIKGFFSYPQKDDTRLFYEASQYAIDFSDTTQKSQILKAELHRERGEFREAYDILHGMTAGRKQWIVNTILYYTCKKDSNLFLLIVDGKKMDCSNKANLNTLTINEELEHLNERNRNLAEYLKSVPSDIKNEIFIDSFGGVYDKSSNTLLKLISPCFKKYNVEAGISHIGDYALYCNVRINRIQLTPDIRTIGTKSFYGCENLSAVLLQGANIEVIEDCAFMNCKSLIAVHFIEHVKYLGKNVFTGMDKLQSVILPRRINTIPEFTFFGCKSLNNIYFPKSIRIVESYSFQHTAITELELPDSIETLGYAVFSRCLDLRTVKLSSKLTVIPDKTFESCKELREIEIPKHIKEIGKDAFKNTVSLKCLRFYGKVKHISETAFKNSGLETIIVPIWTKYHYRRLFPNVKIETKLF